MLVLQDLIVVRQGREHGHQQGSVQLIANGKAITTPVHGKIHAVRRIAVFPLSFQHVVKDQLAQQLGFDAATQFDIFDFPVDVPFFVGQEEVHVAVAADERFPSSRCRLSVICRRSARRSASIWSRQSVTRFSTFPFISST